MESKIANQISRIKYPRWFRIYETSNNSKHIKESDTLKAKKLPPNNAWKLFFGTVVRCLAAAAGLTLFLMRDVILINMGIFCNDYENPPLPSNYQAQSLTQICRWKMKLPQYHGDAKPWNRSWTPEDFGKIRTWKYIFPIKLWEKRLFKRWKTRRTNKD
jgi:hypothetical protein